MVVEQLLVVLEGILTNVTEDILSCNNLFKSHLALTVTFDYIKSTLTSLQDALKKLQAKVNMLE